MEFHDVMQIMQRESRQYLPEFDTFVRLSVMCILGTLSVIFTLLLLCVATKGKGGISFQNRYIRL